MHKFAIGEGGGLAETKQERAFEQSHFHRFSYFSYGFSGAGGLDWPSVLLSSSAIRRSDRRSSDVAFRHAPACDQSWQWTRRHGRRRRSDRRIADDDNR